MKKNYIRYISIIIIAILITINTSSLAIVDIGTKIPEDVTKEFKEWQNLSEEEKENTIQPQAYSLPIENSVKKSILKGTASVGEGSLPNRYVIVDDDKISTLVKDQMNTNECWAFTTTSIIETNVAKKRNKNILLSPRHIDYTCSRTNFLDGENLKGYNRGVGFGNMYLSLAYCVSGKGPVLNEDMPFESNENKIYLSEIDIEPVLKVADYTQFADIYKDYTSEGVKYYGVQEGNGQYSMEYSQNDVNTVREQMKKHLMNNGAISAYTYLDLDLINITDEYTTYYNDDKDKLYNHAITIIGWDDDFSKDNFKEGYKPLNDGAYIVLNTSNGNHGELAVLYVSYDDVWIDTNNFGIDSTTDIDYENIYQYDEFGYNMPVAFEDQNGQNVQTGYIANVFDAKEKAGKDEYINEVSLYVPVTSNVDIYLNTQSGDKTSIRKVASADVLDSGYHTIKLSTPEKITGDKFVVSAKITSDVATYGVECNFNSYKGISSFFDCITANAGEGFYSLDMQEWNDVTDEYNDTSICLKAFTTYQDEPAEEEDQVVHVENISLNKNKIELKEGESSTLVVSLSPSNADNKNITWKSDDESIATVSTTGIIKAVSEGTTTITATTVDGGKVATCSVTVKGKIAEEDEIYYDNNEVNNNGDNNGNTSGTAKDTTTATGTIPQTGEETSKIVCVIIVVIATTVIIFIKYRKNNELK